MTKPSFTVNRAMLVLAIMMIAASGCSSMTNKFSLPTWNSTARPTQIVAVWEPVIRHEDDKVFRGFAAKVQFFDGSAKKALRVRGDFEVYAYDEDDPKEDRVTPSRIIRFQVDDLKNLESDSKLLGKSYTLWVPWDEATNDSRKKRVSLLVRFKCDNGTMVMSKLAMTELPGMGAGEDQTAKTDYVNPYQYEQKQQMAKLEAIAAQHRNNPNSLDTEWKDTVAEYVISREDRPERMFTTTINMPGVSREGVVPTITPTHTFASASDEQKFMAKLMIANAQTTMNRQVNDSSGFNNVQMPPNQNFPINQVGFQSSGENGQVYQQPMLTPNSQPMFQQQPMPQSLSPGLVPMSNEAKYQEYLNWQLQQAMQQQQPPQQPQGNYAAANPGITRR